MREKRNPEDDLEDTKGIQKFDSGKTKGRNSYWFLFTSRNVAGWEYVRSVNTMEDFENKDLEVLMNQTGNWLTIGIWSIAECPEAALQCHTKSEGATH